MSRAFRPLVPTWNSSSSCCGCFSPIDGYKPLVRLKQGCPQTIAQTLKWGVNLYLSTLENIIPHMVVKNGEFHPGRLTWNLQITQLKRKIIFQTIIFRFDVNLPGCSSHGMVQSVKQYHPTKNYIGRESPCQVVTRQAIPPGHEAGDEITSRCRISRLSLPF